jgi:hypothetical protein
MKSLRLKLLLSCFAFLLILATLAINQSYSGEIGKTQNTFVISDEEPGNLLSRLKNAGYGNYNLYQTLLQMQADANPSVAGIITPAFLNTLANCPTGSQIFTTKLNDFRSDNSLAVSTDGTVQTIKVYVKDYFNRTGASTLLCSLSGAEAGDTNFVHSGVQPSTAEFNAPLMSWAVGDTKYNVFAIASDFVPAPTVTPTPTKTPFIDQPRTKNR